jgi:CRP-like cAMP-binding protein
LAQVAAFVDVEHAAAGDEIFAKGDPGDSLYIIAEGQVRLHDEEYVIGEVGPYYTFGEFALLDPAPRSATALAMTDTTLIVIDQATFDELIDDQSSVARRIMQMLVQRIRDARLQLDTEVGWEG